jgi:thiopeptide-type bacteriocin biosynthesis protein
MKNIKTLNEFIVRQPSYSIDKFLEIPNTKKEINNFVQSLFKDTFFKQALYIASPQLYKEWERIIHDNNTIDDKRDKLNKSIIKYYVRISTRCTPFGLFSNYSNIKLDNNISLKTEKSLYTKYFSIDLLFLYAVVNEINKIHPLRNLLKYAPNNSLYPVGKDYRYVEVSYKNSKRFHQLTFLEGDEVIDLLFSYVSEKPRTVKDLADFLLNSIEDINYENIISYVHALIDSQILTSNLDICLNEKSPLHQILNFLEKNVLSLLNTDSETEKIYTTLKTLEDKINSLNHSNLNNSIEYFEEIFKIADSLDIVYTKQYLINANLRKNHYTNDDLLKQEDIKSIKIAIQTLSHFSNQDLHKDSKLNKFKQAFYKKYEEQEVPLMIALDNELGIDYRGNNAHSNAFSDLIDDMFWGEKKTGMEELKSNTKLHEFWNALFHKCIREKEKAIDLSKIDLSSFTPSLEKLPTTFSAMISKTDDKIIIHSIGGNSLNMIGRFTNLDSELDDLVSEITKNENKYNPNSILTEFIHLPNDRDANILARKIKRDIEIPFLSKASETCETLLLNDLYLRLHKGRFVLRSKSLNKEVKIYNSNAHNFRYYSLPVYEFICDLQFDSIQRGLGLNLGSINSKSLKYFPRITYGEKIILSPASWQFSEKDLEGIFNQKTKKYSSEFFFKLKEIYTIPQYVYLTDGDNKLLIDTNNEYLVQYIFEHLKTNKSILLIETIDDVSKRNSKFMNEYIVPFINISEKESMVFKNTVIKKTIKRKFLPGNEWLYYKIYTGIKSADVIISDVLSPMIEKMKSENLINKWFFIRYSDPDFHLRIRFKYNQKISGAIDKIYTILNTHIEHLITNDFIHRIEMSTYERELERYGWELIEDAETLFYFDSDMILNLIHTIRTKGEEKERWKVCLKAIDGYFKIFNLSVIDKYNVMKTLYDGFQKEFNASKQMKKQIDKKFRENKENILEFMNSENDTYTNTIKKRNSDISSTIENLLKTEKSRLPYFISSFIHMTVNRLIISSPRMHELVIYGVLEKLYKIEVYSSKKKSVYSKI